MRTSEQTDAIFAALADAQAATAPAAKDNTNPAFRSRYADLASHVEVIKPAAAAAKVAVLQELTSDDRGVSVVTRFAHASGQWVEFGPLFVPANKYDAQGFGSAASYARRYALSAAWGTVADDDDDGNAAVKTAPIAAQARARVEPLAKALPVERAVVVDEATGEEVPLPSNADGYRVSGYVLRDGWHEAHVLRFRLNGESLKVSTKKTAVGKRLQQFCNTGELVQVDVMLKPRGDEAYLNAINPVSVAQVVAMPRPDASAPVDVDDIPFLWLIAVLLPALASLT